MLVVVEGCKYKMGCVGSRYTGNARGVKVWREYYPPLSLYPRALPNSLPKLWTDRYIRFIYTRIISIEFVVFGVAKTIH